MSLRLRVPACIAAAAVAAGGLLFVAAPAHAAGNDLLGPSVYSSYTPSDSNGDGVVGDVGDTMKVSYQLSNDMDSSAYTSCSLYATLVGAVGVDVPFSSSSTLPKGSSAYKSWSNWPITGAFTDTFYGSCRDSSGWHAWQATSVVWTPPAPPARSLSITGSLSPMDSNLDGVVGDAGDHAAVTYSVTNTGSQTLTAPRIASAAGPLSTTAAITPGSTIQAQTSYTLHAGTNDLSASATATSTTPDSAPVSSPTWGGTFEAAAKPKRALSLSSSIVTSDTNGDGVSGDLGDSAQAVYAVLNIGDQALGVPVVATGAFGSLSGVGSISPGNQQQLVKSFAITDASSTLSASATASATTVTGDNLAITSEPAVLTWAAAAAPVRRLTVSESGRPIIGDANGDGVAGDAGDLVSYPVTVHNTGDQPLGQITLHGLGDDAVRGAEGGIATDAQQSIVLTHVITAAEVASGKVVGSATATASTTTPDKLQISSSALDLQVVPTLPAPSKTHTTEPANPPAPAPQTDSAAPSPATTTPAGTDQHAISSTFGFGFGPTATGGLPIQWPATWTTQIQQVKAAVPTITSTVKVGERLAIAAPIKARTVLKLTATKVNGHTVTSWKRATVAPKYQWYAGGKKIKGATRSTVTLTAATAGKQIVLKVGGRTAAIKIALVASRVGATLTAHTGKLPAGSKIGYQWYANGKALKTATKAKFTVPASLKGKRITVKFAAAKSGYAITASRASAQTSTSAPAPRSTQAQRVTVTISTGSTKTSVTVKK